MSNNEGAAVSDLDACCERARQYLDAVGKSHDAGGMPTIGPDEADDFRQLATAVKELREQRDYWAGPERDRLWDAINHHARRAEQAADDRERLQQRIEQAEAECAKVYERKKAYHKKLVEVTKDRDRLREALEKADKRLQEILHDASCMTERLSDNISDAAHELDGLRAAALRETGGESDGSNA